MLTSYELGRTKTGAWGRHRPLDISPVDLCQERTTPVHRFHLVGGGSDGNTHGEQCHTGNQKRRRENTSIMGDSVQDTFVGCSERHTQCCRGPSHPAPGGRSGLPGEGPVNVVGQSINGDEHNADHNADRRARTTASTSGAADWSVCQGWGALVVLGTRAHTWDIFEHCCRVDHLWSDRDTHVSKGFPHLLTDTFILRVFFHLKALFISDWEMFPDDIKLKVSGNLTIFESGNLSQTCKDFMFLRPIICRYQKVLKTHLNDQIVYLSVEWNTLLQQRLDGKSVVYAPREFRHFAMDMCNLKRGKRVPDRNLLPSRNNTLWRDFFFPQDLFVEVF